MKQFMHEKLLNVISGRMKPFGLPKPIHRIYEKHPIINSELKHQIGHGHINVYSEATGFQGKKVKFKNGVEKQFDEIILATGFVVNYPFLDNNHLNWQAGCPHLYLNIFNVNRKNLYIMGLVSSLGLGWEGRYQQAVIIGKYIKAKRSSKALALRFERLMRKIPDLSGGYNYKVPRGGQYYVNNQAYMKYLKKGIKFLSHD
jgi:hypothetical protein